MQLARVAALVTRFSTVAAPEVVGVGEELGTVFVVSNRRPTTS